MSDRDKITFYGGGIIDEVGLGKTLQITTLSILNTPSSISYVKKRCPLIRSRATLIMCPNHLCGQWGRELKKMIDPSYKIKIIKILSKVHFEKYTYQDV